MNGSYKCGNNLFIIENDEIVAVHSNFCINILPNILVISLLVSLILVVISLVILLPMLGNEPEVIIHSINFKIAMILALIGISVAGVTVIIKAIVTY